MKFKQRARKPVDRWWCHLDVDTPSPPDPFQVAQAEAEFNRINQITPFGSLEFQGPQLNTAVLTLSPELQAAFQGQSAVGLNALSEALRRQSEIPGNLPGLRSTLDIPDTTASVDAVRNAVFQQARGLLDPVFAERRENEIQRLANQGIPEASEAATGEFGVLTGLEREQGRALNEAALAATLAGGQEQSRLVQQALGTQLSELGLQQQVRTQLLNELAQTLGQQQLQQPGLQNFFTPGQVDVPGAFALQQRGQLFNAGAQNNVQTQLLQGLFGLGSSFLLGGGLGP